VGNYLQSRKCGVHGSNLGRVFQLIIHFLIPTVTVLLEYFDPVNHTCLVLHYNLIAALPLAFQIPKGTATIISKSLHQISSHSR